MTTGAGLQLSVAVAIPVTRGLIGEPQGSVNGGGQEIVGAIVSFTVMVCVQVAKLPHASVAW